MHRSCPALNARSAPPSGSKAAATALSVCPVSVWRTRPADTSHRRSALSTPAPKMHLPSGDQAMSSSAPSAPRSVPSSAPEAGSHS
jgi:hypothetical protein